MRKIHLLFISIVCSAFMMSWHAEAELIVINDTLSTITARCLGKGKMMTRTILPGKDWKFGCTPSFVSEGIEVKVKDGQAGEILKETWKPVGMIETMGGKRIVVRVKQESNVQTGAIYKIEVKK